MKITNNLIKVFSLVFSLLLLASCNEEDPIGSEITYYADVQLIGSRTIAIVEGETFNDPGAISSINGEAADYTVMGTVNVNVPGIYKLTYETINAEGFPNSATRTVVVLSSAPSIYDLSGNWTRSNGSPAEVVKISDREYTHNNAGGVTGANQLRVTFYNIDDNLLYIPNTPGASDSGISVESVTGVVIDNNHFNWVLNASGFYGSLLRVFTRV
jgi:hypothetical protein